MRVQIPPPAQIFMETGYQTQRKNLVDDYIIPAGVKDKRVLSAMLTTPRHLFVPKEFQKDAYMDIALPISKGQTISQPSLVATMTQLLRLKGREKVLEIGTGSGYQAAILSKLAKKVYTVEIIKTLAKSAAKKLAKYKNVKVINGDGSLGLPEFAPYDAIIVTAAAPDIPKILIDELAQNGRIAVPVGRGIYNQTLKLGIKKNRAFIVKDLMPVAFVPLISKKIPNKIYSHELGIDLKSKRESELFKWFLACILFGKPIRQQIAKRTYFEFKKENLISPEKIIRAGWDKLVQVLDRGHYVRFDFSTATKLIEICNKLKKDYGNISNLIKSPKTNRDLKKKLQEFKGIGKKTAEIFLRDLEKA